MNTIRLASLPSATPLSRTALRHHLTAIRVPPRSAMLLGDHFQAGETLCGETDRAVAAALQAGLDQIVSCLVTNGAGTGPDKRELERAVGSLAGLGPGLTPTGDDILVALVATSRRFANGGMLAPAAAGHLAAAVSALPEGHTTTVAQHLLSETARGKFPEPLAALVGAVGDANVDRDTVASLAADLTTIGAHSGCDWLAGTLALARACSCYTEDRLSWLRVV